MKHTFLFLILGCAASLSFAGQTDNAPASGDVIKELSKRSGLSVSELKDLLSDCDANQQSMYFCAYRDLVAADLVLKHVIREKEKAFPSCKSTIDADVSSWEKERNRGCEKSASKEYGEGSMKPTAEVMCITFETQKMTQRIQKIQGCDLH